METLGQLSYLAMGKESTAGTPVIPSKFIPFLDEKIAIKNQLQEDNPMFGNMWGVMNVVQGQRMTDGDIEFEVEPNTHSYFLDNAMKLQSTTGSGTYTHQFVVGLPNTYTYEISKGGLYAFRYFGGMVNKLAYSYDNNKLKCVASVNFRGSFSVATIDSASGTSVVLKTDYDDDPTLGLVTGDSIKLITSAGLTEIVTVSSVTNETTLVTSAISGTYASGDKVALVPQTPSYTIKNPFLFQSDLGGTQCLFGADVSSAMAASHTPVHSLTYAYLNNLQVSQKSKNLNAQDILPKFNTAELNITNSFDNADDYQAFLNKLGRVLIVRHLGEIVTGTNHSELRFTYNNIYQKEDQNEVKAKEIILYNRNFSIAHSFTDGQAMDVKLVNGVASI